MKISDHIKSQKAIRKTASRYDTSENDVRHEMQTALDEAWNTKDPDAKRRQNALFPDGKPSLEEFLSKITSLIK